MLGEARWDALFEDLEAQAWNQVRVERAAEVDVAARVEIARLHLVDRVRPAVGSALRLRCDGGLILAGRLVRVGPDWILLEEGPGREALVALAGVLSVGGLGRLSAVPGSEGAVTPRLGLAAALRGVARDRSSVRLHCRDSTVLTGTIDRVGLDFVELALLANGEYRRGDTSREVAVLAIAALAVVRRDVVA